MCNRTTILFTTQMEREIQKIHSEKSKLAMLMTNLPVTFLLPVMLLLF